MLYFIDLKLQSCYYELQLVSIVNMYVKIYRLSIQYVMGNVDDPQALHQDTVAGSRISLIERTIAAKTNGGIIAQFSFLLTV